MAAPNVEAAILQQITADPELPRQNPTLSLWQQPPHPRVSALKSQTLPSKTDYLVIGSGVAGCGAAKELLDNPLSGSKKVTVLEARGLCSGATGRNGGQLTRLPPTRYTFFSDEFGVAQANKIFDYTVKGLEAMKHLATSQGEEVQEFSSLTTLEKFFAYFDEQSWKETVEAINAFEKNNPEQTGVYKLVTAEETASKYNLRNAYGGLRFPAAVVSPYNLITATFDKLLEKYGSRLAIETNTAATNIEYQPESDSAYPYLVTTARGSIRTASVLHCTNGHASHLLPGLRGKMYPRRGTMSVQGPGSRFPDMGGKQSWSLYFSPALDKNSAAVETGRYYAFHNKKTQDLWIGGDKDSIDGFISADDSLIDPHAEKNLREILPKLYSDNWVSGNGDVRGIWTGIMCYTGDHVPFIGRLPTKATAREGKDEWVAGGWNTYGMTNGLLSGYSLARMVLGEDVSAYLPDVYLISEERLAGRRFETAAVMKDYFERIGAFEYM